MTRYFDGRFVPDDRPLVSTEDRGFLFGDGAYEVVPFYAGKPYAMEAHLARFERSLSELRIAVPDLERLPSIAAELLRANGLQGQDALLYAQCTRGVAPRTHYFPDPGVSPTLYASVSRFDRPVEPCARGVSVSLFPDIRWHRCDIKSVNLLPNVLARQHAREAGSTEAIFLRDGIVTEGSHSNLFAVFPDGLRTHPSNSLILSGITRASVIRLSDSLGLRVREDALTGDEMLHADELFLAGTTVEIMPVVEVEGRQIADGRPGPVTSRIREAYLREAMG